MSDSISIECTSKGYTLLVKTKYKTKYWCWAYENEAIAQHVLEKLRSRWRECPVQKYEDYVITFVVTQDQIVSTDKAIENMSDSWDNTEEKRIDLKEVSG